MNNKNFQYNTSVKALLLTFSCLVFILLSSFKDYSTQAFFGNTSLFKIHKTYNYQSNNPSEELLVNGYVKDEKVEEVNENDKDDFHAINTSKLHRYTIYLSDTQHKISYYNLSNLFKNQTALPLFILHQSWQGYLA